MKKIVAIFLTFILIFGFTLPSYASLIEGLTQVNPSDSLEVVSLEKDDLSDDTITLDESEEHNISWLLEQILELFESIARLVINFITNFIEWFLPTIDGAIWGLQDYFQLTFFEAKADTYGVSFAQNLKSLIGSFYNGLRYLVATFYIIILVYLSIRMLLSSIAKQKAHYKTLLQYWVTGLLLLFAFHWVMAFIIWGSNQLTDVFASIGLEAINNDNGWLLENINNNLSEDQQKQMTTTNLTSIYLLQFTRDFTSTQIAGKVPTVARGLRAGAELGSGDVEGAIGVGTQSLGAWGLKKAYTTVLSKVSLSITPTFFAVIALIVLCELAIYIIFSCFISFTYLKRLFTVALLIILFPIVVLAYVFDKIGDRHSQTLNMWIKEFMVNVFIQPIHAALLTLITILLTSHNPLFSIPILSSLFSLLLLALLPIGEKQIKTFFQINSSMGPGNGGIVGTLAHAGMAAKTITSLGNSFVNFQKEGSNLRKAQALTSMFDATIGNLADDAGNKAADKARKQGKSNAEINDAYEKARDRKIEKETNKYKKTMKELTGRTDLEKAKKDHNKKLTTGIVGATFGAGTALATTTSIGDLPQNIVSHSTSSAFLASSAAGIYSDLKKLNKPLESVELDEAEALCNKDFNSLSKDEITALCEATGFDEEIIRSKGNKAKVMFQSRLAARRELLKNGIEYDKQDKGAIQLLDKNFTSAQRILSNRDPNEPSKEFDGSKFERCIDKNNAYYLNTETGEMLCLDGFGDPKANDTPIWQIGDDNDKYIADLKALALEKARKIANNRGITDEKSKAFKSILRNEEKRLLDNHYIAHERVFKAIHEVDHVVLEKESTARIKVPEAVIHSDAAIADHLSTSELEQLDANLPMKDLDKLAHYDPSIQKTREATIEAITSLYRNPEFTKAVEDACAAYATDFYSLTDLSHPDPGLENVVKQLKTNIRTKRLDLANNIDMRRRTDELIQKVIDSRIFDKKATADFQTELDSTTTLEQKQHLLEKINTAQQQVYASNSNASTIVANQDKINIPAKIIGAPIVVADMYKGGDTSALGSVIVSPPDANGNSQVIFTDINNPAKSFTFTSNAFSGAENVISQRPAEITMDEHGVVQSITYAPEELAYALERETEDELVVNEFAEFNLSDLQCGVTSSTEFSIIQKEDICAIIDKVSGKVIGIKHCQTSTPIMQKYDVSQDSNGTLKFNIDNALSPEKLKLRYKFLVRNFAKDEDTKKLFTRLFGDE